jgi:2,4-dienoyl-CoA reductase-like NADH-dependent reductase (Old Yellow Enzyme family)/thioredoxin reductase
MNLDYPLLFSPLRIRNVTFRNRIFSTPNATRFMKDETEVLYLEEKAKGGAALVTVGETAITSKSVKRGYESLPRLDNRWDWPIISEIAMGIKNHGAAASLELAHRGFYGAKFDESYADPVGPMAFVRADGVHVRAMDEDMIEEALEEFAEAANTLKLCGYDVALIHGAHGWLPAQFFSSKFNKRGDRWGGSFENRARFPVELAKRVRKRVGNDLIIEWRISGDEMTDDGMRIEETIELIKLLEEHIDIIHVSAGIHEEQKTLKYMFSQSGFTEHGCNVHLAEAVKKAGVKIPVVTVGGISAPELAEQILADGKADIIGIGRALIADPFFPNKARKGRADEIRPCLRCGNCLHGVVVNDHFACAVNPQVGQDFRWRFTGAPESKKTVVVVGGGPAGMTAAITAADRGHTVTIVEKAPALGGLLRISEHDAFKADMKAYKDYMIRAVYKKCSVLLQTEATPELMETLKPDAVVCAAGSKPVFPPIPGTDGPNVFSAEEAYHRRLEIGERIVIIGAGLVGCETALYFAKELKRKVVLAEITAKIGDPDYWRENTPLTEEFALLPNLTVLPETSCLAIRENGAEIRNKDGSAGFLEADTIILSTGLRPNIDAVEALRFSAEDFYSAGDCNRPRKIINATREGYYAAMDI